MRIIHSVGDQKKEGEGSGSFLLADRRGGYLCLPNAPVNESNYQGWMTFIPERWSLFKTIENIYLSDGEVNTIHNKFSHVERDSGPATERFFVSKNSLIYEVFNYDGFVNVDLDFRHVFDFNDKGRVFEFYPVEGGILIVKYIKYKDASLQEVDYERYMAIKNVQDYWVTGDWMPRCYGYDKERNSRCSFYIYGTLRIKIRKDTRMVFSHAATQEEAMKQANTAWHDLNIIMNGLEKRTVDELKEEEMELNAALNSMNSLTVKLNHERNIGVFAGYPWFFEFWARDELISSKALMYMGDYFLVKEILMEYFGRIEEDGWISNKNVESDLESADATGLLFTRFHDFLSLLKKQDKVYDYFTREELESVKEELDKAIVKIGDNHFKNGLLYNEKLETWMDTGYEGDYREGARVEIQALHLRMLSFGSFISKMLSREGSYDEEVQRNVVKEKFFHGGFLADGFVDEADLTQRPNVFLAHYFYPDLLSDKEWEKVFDNSLESLWLDWGGLSSIDKENPLFKEYYTGETNESYHRGDSWYFVNNIAAICLNRLNPKKYSEKIEKILESSKREMLFSGFLGHCAEISSAKEQQSKGCRSQAWSAATFIELVNETRR